MLRKHWFTFALLAAVLLFIPRVSAAAGIAAIGDEDIAPLFKGRSGSRAIAAMEAPQDDFLDYLELLGDLTFRFGENLPAPSIQFHGGDTGKLNWNWLLWNYDVNLAFQSGFQPTTAENLADQFNLSGGNGSLEFTGGVELAPNQNYRLRLNVTPTVSWLNGTQTLESPPDTETVDKAEGEVNEGVLGIDSSLGIWLRFVYLGVQGTWNSVFSGTDSIAKDKIDGAFIWRMQGIVKISPQLYFRVLFLGTQEGDGRRVQIGLATEFSPF